MWCFNEDVAEAIGTHPENTRLFMDGLAAIELLTKRNGLYQNISVTQTFLVEGTPTYLGQSFTFWNQMLNPALNDLPGLIREGPPTPSPEADMGSEEMWTQHAAVMAHYQRAGWAQKAVEIVSGLPEFPSFRKMLDIGGDPGVVGIALVDAHPSMKGVIFDKPAIASVSNRCVHARYTHSWARWTSTLDGRQSRNGKGDL